MHPLINLRHDCLIGEFRFNNFGGTTNNLRGSSQARPWFAYRFLVLYALNIQERATHVILRLAIRVLSIAPGEDAHYHPTSYSDGQPVYVAV